jgi:pyridoxal phosphate enzyme (YggS family)
MSNLVPAIRENYLQVRSVIENSARRCGRNSDDVKLVVVSKAQPIEVVEAAIEAGIRTFGENYAEEGVEKINHFRNVEALSWHMIGHLQSRKSNLVASGFHYLHSLDSIHLAQRLNNSLAAVQKTLPVLLEMNVSGEESKFGWPAWDESSWGNLLPELDQLKQFSQLIPRGLMTMPPLLEDRELGRPYFSRLRRLLGFLAIKLPIFSWTELSMGTSADYDVAVEEGATFVRVGQAILGSRPAKNFNGVQRGV